MKGILACPWTQTFTEVNIDPKDTLASMYKHLRCKLVDRASIDTHNDIWFDDEGMFNLPIESDTPGFCSHRYFPSYIAGRILILGVNQVTGESRSTTYDINRVKKHIGFWSADQITDMSDDQFIYHLIRLTNGSPPLHRPDAVNEVYKSMDEAIAASGVSDIIPIPVDAALAIKGETFAVMKVLAKGGTNNPPVVHGFTFASQTTVNNMIPKPGTLSYIADQIEADWVKPYFGAVPYINAMKELETIDDNFGSDTAREIVTRFLVNADRWRGDVAKKIKAELRQMIKA
jgi:hypothetical protein